jgi:hypothetical protein
MLIRPFTDLQGLCFVSFVAAICLFDYLHLRIQAPQVRATYALPGTEQFANYTAAASNSSSRSSTPSNFQAFPSNLSTSIPAQRQPSTTAADLLHRPTPSVSGEDLHRRTLLRNMATGHTNGNMDWDGFDPELNMGDSRQEGDLFGGLDGTGLGTVDLQEGRKESDDESDRESVDSWSAELGQLEARSGGGKAKRGKAKVKAKTKAKAKVTKKGKGKEKQPEKVNEYERSRQENMARNAELLKGLGLDHASGDLGFARPKPKPRARVTQDKHLPPALPERRSKRTGYVSFISLQIVFITDVRAQAAG